MAYNPNNPNGQAAAAASAPVVLASDAPLAQDDILAVLNEIQVAVSALSGAKGVLADLRVTPTSTATLAVTQATAANLNATVAQATAASLNATIVMPTLGVSSFSTNGAVGNWQNQTSQQAFTLNVTRS